MDDLVVIDTPPDQPPVLLTTKVPAPQTLTGRIDFASESRCAGWAWLPAEPSRAVAVEFLVNGEKVAEAIADQMREDLATAGIGDGRHGFDIDFPAVPQPFVKWELRVINMITGVDLVGSPQVIRPPQTFFDRFSSHRISANWDPFEGYSTAEKLSAPELLGRIEAAKQKGTPVFVHAPLIDWNTPLFQRPQQMAAALARNGALVIYCTYRYRYDTFEGTWQLAPNLLVSDEFAMLSDTLEGCWFDFYSTSSWPMPKMQSIAARNRIIYEYVDHIDPAISGPGTAQLQATYEGLSAAFITIFLATSKALEADLVGRFGRERVILNPNGTEVEHFQEALKAASPVEQMETISQSRTRPVIGYFGAIAPWLDYRSIEELARILPECQFVYIGPVYDEGTTVPQAPNLHWLGMVPYNLLPGYGRYFDVAIIPFLPGRIAQTTSPLKLFEYFALECPVVVQADMNECCAFDVVRPASGAPEYASQIRQALASDRDERTRRRLREAAESNTWDVRASELVGWMRRTRRRSRHVAATVATSLITGNLEVFRRRPKVTLRLTGSGILFHLDETTPRRGDYVVLGLQPQGSFPEIHLRWRVILAALSNDLLREHRPFVVQLLVNGAVVMEDYLGIALSDLEFGFTASVSDAVELRLVTLRDLDNAWGWGEAGQINICGLEVVPMADCTATVSYVSSLSARRLGLMRQFGPPMSAQTEPRTKTRAVKRTKPQSV